MFITTMLRGMAFIPTQRLPIMLLWILTISTINFIMFSSFNSKNWFFTLNHYNDDDDDYHLFLQSFAAMHQHQQQSKVEQSFYMENEMEVADVGAGITPLRSTTQQRHAQHCVRNGKGAVYVKHFRKAGGTSLYNVLQEQVCAKQYKKTKNLDNLTTTPFVATYASELPYFHPHTFAVLPNSTVFITSLRHPVDRIVSLYWFEGRWPRTCGWECEATKIKNASTKVADLDHWVEAVYHQRNIKEYGLYPHSTCGQWQGVDNYYTRQLLGGANDDQSLDTGIWNKTLTGQDLEQAKAILASFDLVLISEHFSGEHYDADMIHMLYDIVGARRLRTNSTTLNNLTMPHRRQGTERASSAEYESPENTTTWQRLLEWNTWDMQLYEYAIQLKQHQVNKWKQQREQVAASITTDFDDDSCPEAPTTLTGTPMEIALGGPGCMKRPPDNPYFYYPPICLHHSNGPPMARSSIQKAFQEQFKMKTKKKKTRKDKATVKG